MDKICVGVDVGGTTVKIGFFTPEGEIMHKWEVPTRTQENGKYILEDVAVAIEKELSHRNLNNENVIGIGIGVPGPVMEEKTVFECVNLGWKQVHVAEEMTRLTGVANVKVGNDANVAALGEMWKGGGQGYDSIVMVTLGTGVGGGVIINGEIHNGSRGGAGEIGHITINLDEPDCCNCGKRGCLEQYASATGIVKETKRMLAKVDTPSVLRNKEHISAKTIFDAAKAGDALAMELVEQLGKHLGIVLAHISHVVDPQAYVIGGGVSKAGEILTKTISRYHDEYSMDALKGKEFCLATLENDAGIYGSARMIL